MKRDGDFEPPDSWPSLSGVTVPVPAAVSFSPELVDGFRPWPHHLLLAMICMTEQREQVGLMMRRKRTSNEEGFLGSKLMPNWWLVCSIHLIAPFSLVMFVCEPLHASAGECRPKTLIDIVKRGGGKKKLSFAPPPVVAATRD